MIDLLVEFAVPAQEPMHPEIKKMYEDYFDKCFRESSAQKHPWVGLTNDEVNSFAAGCHLGNSVQGAIYKAEAKLREKNGG